MGSTSGKLVLLTSTDPQLETVLSGIVHVHAHVTLHDHTLATFLPPLDHGKMLASWSGLLTQVTAGTRHIIVHISPLRTRTSTGSPIIDTPFPEMIYPRFSLDGEDWEVSGIVNLLMPVTETGPMRGEVQRLFVSPWHRKKEIARMMMKRLEEIAWEEGRWSLMLDTTVGLAAEEIYPKFGWRSGMVVEAYGVSPKDGSLVDEVWFWKDLRKARMS